MPDVLNLAGADTSGPDFDPVPTGWYPCVVVKIEDKFTKGGPEAALPAGTPMLNIHLKIQPGYTITEEDKPRVVGGKFLFKQLVIPPAKVNGKPYEHFKSMMGQVARFFIAAGVPEETVLSDTFDISDREQFYGNEIGVRARKHFNDYKGEWDNEVQSFKPVSELNLVASETAGIV